MGHEQNLKTNHPTEYQQAVIFQIKLQKSERCKKFRKAWGIPLAGFNDQKDYSTWKKKLVKKTNVYLKSEKYKGYEKTIAEKYLLVGQGKISDGELQHTANLVLRTVPLHAFDYNVGRVTIEEDQPEYMRDFVEQCLLFKKPSFIGIVRPKPKPVLKFDSYSGTKRIIIEEIHSDTSTKDFDDSGFTRELRKLQKELLGLSKAQGRFKKSMEYGVQLLDLDKTNLTDIEKADILYKTKADETWRQADNRAKGKVRQARFRNKKHGLQ
jgi:hypothetical protein